MVLNEFNTALPDINTGSGRDSANFIVIRMNHIGEIVSGLTLFKKCGDLIQSNTFGFANSGSMGKGNMLINRINELPRSSVLAVPTFSPRYLRSPPKSSR